MNYQNWSKKKFWIVIVGIFFLGMIIAPKGSVREVVKEVPTQCDYSNWRTLKEIDDIGFTLSAEGLDLCSRGFYAVSELDVDKLTKISAEMETLTPKIQNVANRRQSILKTLGY